MLFNSTPYQGHRRSVAVAALATLWLLTPLDSTACTTAVISGRATADGRPLLWKNRDTTTGKHNEVVHFGDGPIAFVGVVNAGKRESVWMGVNDAGFCIENSVSKDLADQSADEGPGNGSFIKTALSTCRNVEDFAALLRRTDSHRRTVANFGVIDASGGAAIFETGPKTHTMFDVNDPAVAPNGFLVRANFSTTARGLGGDPPTDLEPGVYSTGRYCRAKELLLQAPTGGITVPYVMQNLCRDLADPSGVAYPGSINGAAAALPPVISTDTTLSRTTTVSAVVFEGVAAGEDPRATTMWTLLGDPKFTVAVPCWASVTEVADAMAEPTGAEIGEIAMLLREWCLDGRDNEIDTSPLPGIWEDLLPLERRFYQRTDAALDRLRQSSLNEPVLTRLHQSASAEAMAAMTTELEQLKAEVLTRTGSSRLDDRVAAGPLRVAICDHTEEPTKGAANLLRILTVDNGFQTDRVTSQQIADGVLDQYDVVAFPGGSGSGQAKRLGEAGAAAVKDFVSTGGGYVGICAGAYLASSQYEWSLGLINARVFDRVHWARGQSQVELSMTPAGQRSLTGGEATVPVYYGQGPLLLPDDHEDLPPYEVLASYQTEVALKGAPECAMIGTHAIVRGQYGDGRVLCISPHPETSDGPNGVIVAAFAWAGKKP